jgi:transaldolase
MNNRVQQLTSIGQSIWLDYISRNLIESGRLEEFVELGVKGVTSNPSIFQKAIASSADYDSEIRRLAEAGRDRDAIYEALVLRDIQDAARILRPVYNETHGRDGFVSIEVSPHLAYDTEGTIAEARRLFHALQCPNVMIKVPATREGLPAITTLIGEGINVNVTLIFSISMYERVMQAYIEGLRRLDAQGGSLGLVASVASFFVSRVDNVIDKQLQERIDQAGATHLEPLLGHAAVANAKLAYQHFKQVFETDVFREFRDKGARPQRPLWASTSTKNPAYPDTKYVDTLIGVQTVNTMPLETLEAFRDHGVVAQTIEDDVAHAQSVFSQLGTNQIDVNAATDKLLHDGVQLFAEAFDKLLADVEAKRNALTAAA